jgi:glucosamine--fructose-6-phosphate aminotransferase (isomerizing)
VESEISAIPYHAVLCYDHNKGLILPDKVPYIGMGSSYYAALVLRYLGKKIYPELASEYFNYLENMRQFEKAVLISQSGESSETLWCAGCFEKFVCIVNDTESPLGHHPGADIVVDLCAGEERYSSAKTFINSLIVLFLGHGIDPKPALVHMQKNFPLYRSQGYDWGKQVYSLLKKKRYKGFYILGAGPNLGAARQAALVLTQITKYPFYGMSMAQYDHGIKEAAGKSVVFAICPDGIRDERPAILKQKIKSAGGVYFQWNEPGIPEYLSPVTSAIPFFFLSAFLKKRLKIKDPFLVGDKITRTRG